MWWKIARALAYGPMGVALIAGGLTSYEPNPFWMIGGGFGSLVLGLQAFSGARDA